MSNSNQPNVDMIPQQPIYPGQQPGYPAQPYSSPDRQPKLPVPPTNYDGLQPNYTAQQLTYPPQQPSYTGQQFSNPGQQFSNPGQQSSYPGQQLSYPTQEHKLSYPIQDQQQTTYPLTPTPNQPPPIGFASPRQSQEEHVPAGAEQRFLEDENELKGVGFSERTIRQAFIRKVYSILMCQLLVRMAFIALFMYHEPAELFVRRNPYLILVAFVTTIVTVLCMACCVDARRKAPVNFIFLGLFTVAESLLLGIVCTRYRASEVLVALGMTAVVCLTLTLYAFQTKRDFTTMGGMLVVSLVILFLFGILCIFVRNRVMSMLYASAGALLFSFYLIYDTQLMIGGNHKYSISPEEYIFATLNLYLDIINIFLFILKLMAARN